MSVRLGTGLLIVAFAACVGCREDDPPEAYLVDLSRDGERRLLPLAVGHPSAHDARIRQGNNRATIVKLGDFDADAPMPVGSIALSGATPDLGPADSVGEALSNVGQAFLGNLLGGSRDGVAAGGAATPADAAAPGADATATAPDTTVKLSHGDVETLHGVVERFSRARSARKYLDLPDLSVSEQRSTAVEYYDRLAELHATYANLVQAYDRVAAGTKATFDGQLAEALPAFELIELIAVDANSAQGSLRPKSGGSSQPVRFRREAGFWRIEDPYVPAAAKWAEVEATLDDAVESLNEIDNDLLDEKRVEAARVREALTKAVDLLSGKASA